MGRFSNGANRLVLHPSFVRVRSVRRKGICRVGRGGLPETPRGATMTIATRLGTEVWEMDQKAIRELVLEHAVEREGRKILPCARAFEIHRRYGIPLADIGRACDENDIRIRACQLGCFQ